VTKRAPLSWRYGDADARALADPWWQQGATADVSVETIDACGPRRVVRLARGDVRHLVKHFRTRSGGHRLRERAKAWAGLGAPEREWRALHRVRARGVPAPRPLGLAHDPGGDCLLVVEAHDAPTLWALLERGVDDRRALLARVADAVAALHAEGLAHGDLHPGNVLIDDGRPVWIDLQRCRRARRGGAAQRRDVGLLDYSLRQLGVSRPDRLRVLVRALGLTGHAPRARRRQLRRAIREAERTSRRQTRTRARHGRPAAGGASWRMPAPE
jgi:serine/threonine-protein kinase RIO1